MAASAESSRLQTTASTPASTMPPAWIRLPRSRLFNRPTRQLQGTAMFTINLLINFFSFEVSQPHTPMK